MMTTAWENRLSANSLVLADGGMGTTLFSLGLDRGIAPELWNLERSETIAEIHRGYIQAGPQIILTNSFGGNRARLSRHNIGDQSSESE